MKYLITILFTTGLILQLAAQNKSADELLSWAKLPPHQFDELMFKQGFTCQKRVGNVTGWLCIYAKQPGGYMQSAATASTLMEYISNAQSTVLVYQFQGKEQSAAIQKRLTELGFSSDDDTSIQASGRRIFHKPPYIINIRDVDQSNGIMGNYSGFSLSIQYNRLALKPNEKATQPLTRPMAH